MASDEFVASVQRQLFSTPINTFRFDLTGYKGDRSIIDFLDSSAVKSFSGVCEELAKKGLSLLLFDGLANINDDPSLVARMDEFAVIVHDYSPQAYLVLRSRARPRTSRNPFIELKALDEADCREYIAAHEIGGPEYTNIDAVTRVFRFTDGVPSKIDNALRDIQIVGLSGLIPLNTDLINFTEANEAQSSTLERLPS